MDRNNYDNNHPAFNRGVVDAHQDLYELGKFYPMHPDWPDASPATVPAYLKDHSPEYQLQWREGYAAVKADYDEMVLNRKAQEAAERIQQALPEKDPAAERRARVYALPPSEGTDKALALLHQVEALERRLAEAGYPNSEFYSLKARAQQLQRDVKQYEGSAQIINDWMDYSFSPVAFAFEDLTAGERRLFGSRENFTRFVSFWRSKKPARG